MKEQTGDTYQGSTYSKSVFVSTAKVGKSSFIVASALGVLPWQREGGVVDHPKNLHVLAIDANSLGGIRDFLVKSCGASGEALQYQVYNLQDDVRQAYAGTEDYDLTFYNVMVSTLERIKQKLKGVPFVHIASLTGAAMALERSIVGPPGSAGKKNRDGDLTGKGYSDVSKWKSLEHQLNSLQNMYQVDTHHLAWEAHIDKGAPPITERTETTARETIKVSGSAGRHWATNAEQVFAIKREFGNRHLNTQVDKVHLDTRNGMEALQVNGRKFNECLDPQERDMAVAFKKLGLKVGHWGQKKVKAAP